MKPNQESKSEATIGLCSQYTVQVCRSSFSQFHVLRESRSPKKGTIWRGENAISVDGRGVRMSPLLTGFSHHKSHNPACSNDSNPDQPATTCMTSPVD